MSEGSPTPPSTGVSIDEKNNTNRPLIADELRFAQLALEALGWERAGIDSEVELRIPEDERDEFGGAETLTLAADTSNGHEPLRVDSPAVGWLQRQLRRAGPLHASPARQPTGVNEISSQLFSAYTVTGGSVRLSGCTLESRALLRISRWNTCDDVPHPLRHSWVTAAGIAVEPSLRSALELDRLAPLTPLPRVSDAETAEWFSIAHHDVSRSEDNYPDDIVILTVAWCTHAEGKLEFEIGDSQQRVAFSGWAMRFESGAESPPPFRCPHTGATSYEVAATDDGRLTVKEMLGVCQVSGQRVLQTELGTCAVTGQTVQQKLLARCPVSDEWYLQTSAATCSVCRRAVSPRASAEERCTACRQLASVSKDDPRMARILGEHPRLDRWRRWKLSETAEVYVLCASSLVRRTLYVIDKESLALLRVAVGSRFSRQWADAPPVDQADAE